MPLYCTHSAYAHPDFMELSKIAEHLVEGFCSGFTWLPLGIFFKKNAAANETLTRFCLFFRPLGTQSPTSVHV
jgi:hypothetical protein